MQTKGETCEICNGNLPLLEDTLAEILPESRFDEDYFEELERYFESRPIAA